MVTFLSFWPVWTVCNTQIAYIPSRKLANKCTRYTRDTKGRKATEQGRRNGDGGGPGPGSRAKRRRTDGRRRTRGKPDTATRRERTARGTQSKEANYAPKKHPRWKRATGRRCGFQRRSRKNGKRH